MRLHDNFFTTLPVEQLTDAYCVYEHWMNDPDPTLTPEQAFRLMFISYCKLYDVFTCPEARRNNEWQKHFKSGVQVTLRIIMTTTDAREAMNYAQAQVREKRPFCNIRGYRQSGRTLVICNENGETYRSAADAAKALGLSQSQLTNHLNHVKGYRTVRGFTFKRGMIEG